MTKISNTFFQKSWRKLITGYFSFCLIQKGEISQKYLYSLKFSRKQKCMNKKAENSATHFNEVGWKQLNFCENKGNFFVSTLPSSTVRRKQSVLEFQNNLWGLQQEQGCCHGPPDYIGWWKRFLGIDPGILRSLKLLSVPEVSQYPGIYYRSSNLLQ